MFEGGTVLANVFMTKKIVKIDKDSGDLLDVYDLTDLQNHMEKT
jgi:glutamine cyclotransferase